MVFDIETTGFDRKRTQVVLVGMIVPTGEGLLFKQIFSEGPGDEIPLLVEMIRDLGDREVLISYNGDRFDIPYLNARYHHHHLDYRIAPHLSFDLIRYFRDNRRVYNLPDLKLKTVERVLGIDREDGISGGESVALYLDYLRTRDSETLERILLHNHDDIVNLALLCQKTLQLDPLTRSYLPRMIHLGPAPAYFSRVDHSDDLIVFTFEKDQALPPIHRVETHFMIDTVSSHRILHLPLLYFSTPDGDYGFIDPDRLFGLSFDGMTSPEKAGYLLLKDDRVDYAVLEKILNKKVDIG